jgi:hypothetical protein
MAFGRRIDFPLFSMHLSFLKLLLNPLFMPTGFKPWYARLEERHRAAFRTLEKAYATKEKRWLENEERLQGKDFKPVKLKTFGRFEDEDGFAGKLPSLNVFVRLFYTFMEAQENWRARCLQLVDGRYLKIDATFKFNRPVLAVGGGNVKDAVGLFTIQNEYGQIVAQWAMVSGELHALGPAQ